MDIINVNVRNSRVGVHSFDPKEKKVMQLITLVIQYDNKKSKEVLLGLKKHTSLAFCCKQYFGISYQNDAGTTRDRILELLDKDGNSMTSIPQPKGEIISVFEEMFIVKDKDNVYAYGSAGTIVATGKFPKDGSSEILLNKITP